MRFTLEAADFGRLACAVSDGRTDAVVTASDLASAAAELNAAIDSAGATGYGECFWQEGGGEYRWMLRRHGELLDVTVLWSSGTLTGWEHVFRANCDFGPLAEQVHDETRRVLASLPAD